MTYFNEARQKARQLYYPPPKTRKTKSKNMATKTKSPPKVNAADVTSMLKLVSKNGYSTKMSNLLNFLNQTASIRIGSEVVETGTTIDQHGKLWTHEEMIKEHRENRKNRFEFEIPEDMAARLNEIESNIVDLKLELKKTRKLEKKETLGNTINALWDDHHKLREEIGKLEDAAKAKWDSEADSETVPIQQLRESLMFYEGCKIRIDLQTGSYTFPVPVGTPFYREVCNILGLPLENQEPAEKPVIKKMFSMPSEIIQALKKGLKFVSGDDLRPAMTGVLLEINDGKAQVIATDAHRLYMSRLFDIEGPPDKHEYIIPAKAINRLPRSIDGTFYLYEFKDGTIKMPDMNGKPIFPIDARFPDYKVVVPKYEGGVTFERENMIDSVKSILPYCNKSTSQININFNGLIEFAAQDIDFSFEGGVRMAYKSKEMDDLLIAFNGKFLIEALKTFESNEIIFKGEAATKAGILTDGVDSVLIMPLMLNN